MQRESNNGDSRGIHGAASDSLIAAIHELRLRPRSQWLDWTRTDQSQRWRRGTGVASEQYLTLLPELLADREEALVLICGEIQLRREAGEQPTVEEYQQRFPQLASAIALQFDVDRMFEPAENTSAISDANTLGLDMLGYELLERIGSGSSGAVYRAVQTSLQRIVAIKVCSIRCADPKTLVRLEQEGEILARLNHPHVVQVYEVVRDHHNLYLVMEFVEGSTLQEHVAGRPLPPRDAAARTRMLAEAIEKVHQSGVLHRDLKPSNILVSSDGQLKITDFGLAKLRTSDNLLTTADSLLGTPGYMAPEQATGAAHSVGPEADVYSLGVILYELITGRPPFLGATVLDTLSLIREHEAAPPRSFQPSTPRDLETITLKCLEKDPSRRYPTAAALAADLERYLAGAPILARRPTYAERIVRWAWRNPLTSALITALILAITGGFAASLWQWQEAEVARQEADRRIVQLQDAVSLVDRARVFRDWGNWNDARECLDEALRLRPEYRNAWEERSYIYGHFALWNLALVDRRAAMKLGEPSLSIQWWDYAVLLAHARDHDGLTRLSARMRERFRGHTGIYLLDTVRISCLLNLASTDYDRLIELFQLETPPDTPYPMSAYVMGLACYRVGQFQEAVKWCQKSIELAYPLGTWNYALNYPVLAMAHRHLGQAKDVENALRFAGSWENHWTQQLYDSGIPYGVRPEGAFAWPSGASEWLEFQTLLSEARQEEHTSPESRDFRWRAIRARSFAALGRYADAAGEFEEAMRLSPENVQLNGELHRSRGMATVERGDYARAAKEFGEASRLAPQDPLMYQYHAQASLYAGEYGAYRRICREMLKKFAATDSPEAAARVVYTCTQLGDALPNMAELTPLAKLAAHAWAEWVVGATCVRTGDYTEALRNFRQAESRHVPRARDLCFKAIAYHQSGQREKAKLTLQEARDWIRRADRERLRTTDVSIPSWEPWYEPAEATLLLTEAEAVLTSQGANGRY